MRLLSASVKNYRIHGDIAVDFSNALTLIGGKNETGKSTLAEAIHRALFLKATTGGKVQESMLSDIHQGHPEVEVHFSAAGSNWHLKKIFSKSSGKATLTEEGGVALHGPEAEARLANLMQIEEPEGGQGGAKKSLSQWAHLWVWQGSGGDDPTDHAAPQRDALLSRLKEQGGGAVMQSDLDSRVASHFEEECDAVFTKAGQPKAGSDLFKAAEEKAEAESALEEATESLTRLEGAAREFQAAESVLSGGEKQIAELARQFEASREKAKQITELRHRAELEQRTLDEAKQAEEQFLRASEEVARTKEEVNALEEKTKPGAENLEKLESSLKQKRAVLGKASAEVAEIEAAYHRKQETRELAEAWGHLLKNRNQFAELQKALDQIAKKEAERKSLEEKLAALPAIDEPTYRALQQAESSASEARAVLEAMSTGLEVVRSDETVRAGKEEIPEGSNLTLDQETALTIGDSVVLTISPGGGNNLDEARDAAKERKTARDTLFRNAGVSSLSEAGEVRGQRASHESNLQEILASLKQRNEQGDAESLKEASKNVVFYEGEVERRAEQLADFSPPKDSSEARSLWESIRAEVSPLEAKLSEAKNRQAAVRNEIQAAEEARDRKKEDIASAQQELIEKKALLKAKREPLGTAEEQKKKVSALAKSLDSAQGILSKTREALATLQPESIDADISRLQRSIEIKKSELETAGQTRAVARNILSHDGAVDPAAAVSTARARAESADERHRSLNRRAEAIRLLRDRFAEEQQKLSDRFSQPLAEKVTGYLRQIFGPTASAGVSVQDGVIGGWTMSRDTGTFEFSSLSGGTREQVAAAVRLALAEILAEDHGGSLPVIFDDAFTNSDPSRTESLQRMLDLAARSGLQIIVLTCDPDDYAGLGAKTVTLSSSQ